MKKDSDFPIKNVGAPFKEVGISAILVGLLVVLIIKYRRRWYPYFVLVKYQLRKSKQIPEQDFEILIKSI